MLVLDGLGSVFCMAARRRFPTVELGLLGMARECGVSLPDSALTRQALYE